MAQDRYLSLRRADICIECGAHLVVGTRAWWDATARTVTCIQCGPWMVADSLISDDLRIGTPGASAQRLADRLKSRQTSDAPRDGSLQVRERRVRHSVQSWEKGAAGERKLGEALNELAGANRNVIVLHDRRIPKSRANIDHIAIAPSGVYVIDPKAYTGRVKIETERHFLRTDRRLVVNDRNRSKLISGMDRQVIAVSAFVGTVAPVVPVLCFVDSEWSWLPRPKKIDGVLITWGADLRRRLAKSGSLTPNGIANLATRLDQALVPAA